MNGKADQKPVISDIECLVPPRDAVVSTAAPGRFFLDGHGRVDAFSIIMDHPCLDHYVYVFYPARPLGTFKCVWFLGRELEEKPKFVEKLLKDALKERIGPRLEKVVKAIMEDVLHDLKNRTL